MVAVNLYCTTGLTVAAATYYTVDSTVVASAVSCTTDSTVAAVAISCTADSGVAAAASYTAGSRVDAAAVGCTTNLMVAFDRGLEITRISGWREVFADRSHSKVADFNHALGYSFHVELARLTGQPAQYALLVQHVKPERAVSAGAEEYLPSSRSRIDCLRSSSGSAYAGPVVGSLTK